MPLNITAYAIYLNPPSHPNKWVVMKSLTREGSKPTLWIVTDSYLEALSRIPKGLTRTGPADNDATHLYETWR